jgi:NADPH-dependent curcumin reductase CurA
MEIPQNECIVLAARPSGLPEAACWRLECRDVPPVIPGQVLVEVDTISIDPAMRAWMDEFCYLGCVELNQPMWAFGIGRVVDSASPDFEPGDTVRGLLGVQRYSLIAGDELETLEISDEPHSWHLGIFGMPGLTGYFGMTDLVQPRPGQQVLVSTAAGAVGSVVAQLAKRAGARVVGIAGGTDKNRFCLDELGLDACVDYKAANYEQNLAAALPDGVDIYFDNVGVPTLDMALRLMNECGTVIACGAINQFQHMDRVEGPTEYLKIPERKLSFLGFTCFHYLERFHEGVTALRALVERGELVFKEDIAIGLANFPEHFLKQFTGQNQGKLILKP